MRRPTLTQRVATLEADVRDLKRRVDNLEHPGEPWWEQIYGTFAAEPAFEKAMALGH